MTQAFYGKDLAKYKLERAKEAYIASKEEAEGQIQTAKMIIDLVGEYISKK
ncbi:MAG: hypothetical protein K2N55_09230 [Lachnospiraceae bacterium]|nr:hypothetical protein [Lachnospiraceae bacterium]